MSEVAMAFADVRVFLYLTILSTIYGPIVTQPMFGALYCNMFCDDYDYDRASSTTSLEDLLDAVFGDPCVGCPTRPPSTTTTTPGPNGQQPFPFNFVFPPSGMNMTMGRTGNNWFMNFMPWSFSGATPTPTNNNAATPAPNAPAAPAAAGNSTNTTMG